MANIIEVKNMEQAACLLEDKDVRVLQNMIDTLVVKHRCDKMNVSIMPYHEIANTGIFCGPFININGLNTDLMAVFRIENKPNFVPEIRDLSWCTDQIYISKHYPFAIPARKQQPKRQAVRRWNRIR